MSAITPHVPGVVVVPDAAQARVSLGPAGHQHLTLVPVGPSPAPVTLGCSWFRAGATSDAIRHDVDEFAYVIDGAGWIVNPDGAAWVFSPGDGLIIRAHEWHAVRAGDAPVRMVFGFGVSRTPVTDRWSERSAITDHNAPGWWPSLAVNCFDDLSSYRLVGASQCIDRIGEALVAVAELVDGSCSHVLEEVALAGARFSALKPDTPLYANVIEHIADRSAPVQADQSGAQVVAGRVTKLRRDRRAELDAIEAHTSDLVGGVGVVVVHDYSSTVMGVARRLAQRHGALDFVVTAAEPLGSGLRVAQELHDLGHRVTYCADASVARQLGSASCYLTGVEAFYTDGSLANTVGTYALALLCREAGVPVYALAEQLKAAGPPPTGRLPATLLDRWPRTVSVPEGVTVDDHVLDTVPAPLIRGYMTATGLVSPDRLARQPRRGRDPRG